MTKIPGFDVWRFTKTVNAMCGNFAVDIFEDLMSILKVYIKRRHHKKIPQLAGMLRGLANSYDGFTVVAGLSNSRFHQVKHVYFRFRTVQKARSFQRVAEAVLGRYIETKH